MSTTGQTTKLEQLAREVLTLRVRRQGVKGTVDGARERWEQTHKNILEEYDKSGEYLALAEAELRTAALEVFEATGDKHPGPGVGIRVTKKVDYNEGSAFLWALEHRIALNLDRKAFESLAKSGQVDVIVFLRDEAIATIAQNLEAALATVETAPSA